MPGEGGLESTCPAYRRRDQIRAVNTASPSGSRGPARSAARGSALGACVRGAGVTVLPTVCARTPETDFTSPASHPFKVRDWVTSLALQWLRLCLPMQKAWVQSLVEEL